MNRTVKEATVEALHHGTVENRRPTSALVRIYNLAEQLQALRWRIPFQAARGAWAKDPSPLRVDPHQLIPGPHT